MNRESSYWRLCSASVAMAMGLLGLASGCKSALPQEYTQQAEPGVTLTKLTAAPDRYREKVVILGGVVVEQVTKDDQLWLRMRNRPLDEKYHPHRPDKPEGPEAGHYWLTMANRSELADQWKKWTRMTVVGRVAGTRRVDKSGAVAAEPVLVLLYMRGWKLDSSQDGFWEQTFDVNYLPVMPEGIQGELGVR